MGRIGDNIGILYLVIAVVVYLNPRYALHDSRIATIVILFATITASKLIYNLFLYPRFFTPLKHFPAPSVSNQFPPFTDMTENLTPSRIGTGYWVIREVCLSKAPMS